MSLRSTLIAGCGALLAFASPAFAGTDTDSLTVSATVIASCDVTAGTLAFGNYDPVSATALDASTSISVVCTNGTSYEVSMNAGLGAGATVATRKMTSGGQTLNYTLYRDSNRTNLWGVTSGSNVYTGSGIGAAQSIPVYGRVPAQQTSQAGAYSDTVTVTVTY